MRSRFFSWWSGELGRCLPAFLRASRGSGLRVLELRRDDGRTIVSRRSGDSRDPIAEIADADEVPTAVQAKLRRRFNPRRTRVSISLPREAALTRTVQLPSAAEENLHEVLGYELHRLTPFKREDVYFQGHVRARKGPQLEIDLTVVPKTEAARGLEIARQWDADAGARPLEIRSAGDRVALNFDPETSGTRASTATSLLLMTSNTLLLVALVAYPLFTQHQALEALRSEVESARSVAKSAADIRQRIEALKLEVEYLARQKRANPPMVVLLEELSRALPDDTWLHQLEVKEGEVYLGGYSSSASALIEQLETSPLLAEVRFVSPVTLDSRMGAERFDIGARITASATEDP